MKLDLHCHTREGSLDGKITLLENIALLKKKGYQGMLLSDHNSYKAYKYWEKNIKGKVHVDFTVLKGIEYDTIDAGHILVIMPRGVRIPILELRGLPVLLLIEIVHHYGGILGPAHPCGEKYLSLTNTRRGRKNQEIMKRFDFIETFNACETEESNAMAAQLAQKLGKPGFGGSDSHKEDCVGLGYTLIDAEILEEDDLIRCVKSDTPISAGGERYLRTTKAKIGKANYILIYSFWVYNKGAAFLRRHKRKLEILEHEFMELIRPDTKRTTGLSGGR